MKDLRFAWNVIRFSLALILFTLITVARMGLDWLRKKLTTQ